MLNVGPTTPNLNNVFPCRSATSRVCQLACPRLFECQEPAPRRCMHPSCDGQGVMEVAGRPANVPRARAPPMTRDSRPPARAPPRAAWQSTDRPSRRAFSRSASGREPGSRPPVALDGARASGRCVARTRSVPPKAPGRCVSAAGRRPAGAFRVEERACSKAKRAPVRATARNLHHQRRAAPLGAADGQQRALERGRGIGGRARRARRRPVGGYRLATFLAAERSAGAPPAEREVDDHRRPTPLRCGKRDRVGAEHGRLPPQGAMPWACCRRRAPAGRPRQSLDMTGRRRRSGASARSRRRRCRRRTPAPAAGRWQDRRPDRQSRCARRSSGSPGASAAAPASHTHRPCRPWPARHSSAREPARGPSVRRSRRR